MLWLMTITLSLALYLNAMKRLLDRLARLVPKRTPAHPKPTNASNASTAELHEASHSKKE